MDDVWICMRECRGSSGRLAAEQQHRAIGGIRERSAEHEITARDRRPCVIQVRTAQRQPPFHIVVDDVVDEQIVQSDPRSTVSHSGRKRGGL